MADELDDITLSAARRGDPRALGALVLRYQGLVHALCYRMLAGDPSAVDDACQEALLKVIRGLGRFNPAGTARLSTWIVTVATRACIDGLRRRGRMRALDDPVAELADGENPERVSAARELSARVALAMAKLPAEYRIPLVLRAYHDMDYDEIANTLGVAEGTVKSRIARARVALRGAVGGAQHVGNG